MKPFDRMSWTTASLLWFTAHTAVAGGPFDDEFTGQVDLLNNNTSAWSVLGAGSMDERATTIDIDGGLLTVIPEVFTMNAWFEDEYGPLVYQDVTGNFAVVINLRVSQTADIDLPPDTGFNAGGFIIRDASGTHNNDENWMMYNMGGQGEDGVTFAREMKKTVGSTSNLFLTEQIGMEEYLLACRVGADFYFYYWADAVGGWRQETYYNQFNVDGTPTTTWHNSSSVTPEISPPGPGGATPMHFNHPAMPNTIQVGLMGGTWSNGSNGVRADFDFIRFAPIPPVTENDCTAAFADINDLIFADDFE
ncbi:hypothetical protein [Marinicella meishanensis]|uniref:hypothetical protein n=1 Tax=Marinicella meishanensis TaxID=2873263 RepID=UPI001CBD0EE0|nr:hypothetical protein [Marinicella sp. NBU2979]